MQVVLERVAWIRSMLAKLRRLPTADAAAFIADERTPAAAESYLRRALEALFDVGRHILAKGFGQGVVEYRAIADGLVDAGVLDAKLRPRLHAMAGYRNRLTHFYDEITAEELRRIVTDNLDDIEAVVDGMLGWLRAHPEATDKSL